MKTTSYGKSQRLKSLLMLCPCLVLVCLISIGATGSTAGNLPRIELLKAEPLVLNDGDAAVYTFVVKGATEIQLIEAGNIIKVSKGPTSATLKGTVEGLPTYAIRTGDSNTFDTVLKARNESGEVEKKLTLSFATELPPKPASLIPPVSDILSEQPRSPQWLDQSSLPPLTQPTSTTTRNEPDFFKCPSSCNYCLKPDEAANLGFTQRCSEQLCYYSPDNQQKWYCYSEPVGWCCKDTKVSQATKTQCDQEGGYWYANQAEAVRACQPMCWCCAGGKVGQVPQAQCAQLGGDCFGSQAEAIRFCQQMMTCWCCAGGKVGQIPQAQCAQIGGRCFATQTQAQQACQPTPATCWCCAGGKVGQIPQAQCAQIGGRCFATQTQAQQACRPPSYQPPTSLK
jgi:hypothetical protein